ncbi:MAG: hypothetical protein EBR82_08800 [Caulobacteraceae bacterium]|nr:hypothetical protein [Caulobacteraceae bacterium]
MLKKIVLAAALATASIVSASAAQAGGYEACMIAGGCFVTYHEDENGAVWPEWTCRNPAIYMLCDADEGPYPGDGLVADLQALAVKH